MHTSKVSLLSSQWSLQRCFNACPFTKIGFVHQSVSCVREKFGGTLRPFKFSIETALPVGDSRRSFSNRRSDPFAKRPNQVCDPYGQGGKPLSRKDAEQVISTLHESWQLEYGIEEKSNDAIVDNETPVAVARKFHHLDYVRASLFISKIAALGDIHNHYPTITLERVLLPKEKRWQVTTTVRCNTITLGGLSHNDFYVAMLIDVEAARPEVSQYLQTDEREPVS